MATKFKPLDIVENIHIGEIEMVGFSYIKYFQKVGKNYDGVADILGYLKVNDYRKLSYKDVKINLNTKNK